MAEQLFQNNFSATLVAPATGADVTLALSRADLPEIAGGDWMLLTLEDSTGSAVEIVKVTAHVQGSAGCAVERAMEGTAARAWSAGTKAENRLTAGTLAPLAAVGGAFVAPIGGAFVAAVVFTVPGKPQNPILYPAKTYMAFVTLDGRAYAVPLEGGDGGYWPTLELEPLEEP